MLKGSSLPLCNPTQRLIEALPELSLKRCGCLLIVDELMNLQGIFTDGDLRRCLEILGSRALDVTLKELMNPSPRAITSDKLAVEAMQRMEEDASRPIMVLPVIEQRRVVGLLRLHDILQSGL